MTSRGMSNHSDAMNQARPRRRHSKRRQLVLDGALKAIAIHGVEGLTHRRVAEAAGVSVSATTYHFSSLEELLEAAIRAAADQDIATLGERFHPGMTGEEFADYVVAAARTRTQETIVASELYVAALRREGLREVAIAWDRAWIDVLKPIVGDNAAAVTAAIGGLLMRRLYEDERDIEEFAASIHLLMRDLSSTE
ncbi:MAG TPA: TetR family transcriptional regulator [Baekduia sp.]|nr:TetR family transcriptional regulator [Baekduia sp.]